MLQQLSPWATATEPVCARAVLCNKRSHGERAVRCNQRKPVSSREPLVQPKHRIKNFKNKEL